MKIKNFSSSGPEAALQDQLIAVEHIDLKDGILDSLFEKLSIVEKKDVEDDQLTNNLDSDTGADEPNENYDESQLKPKGPVKKKDSLARDLPPYELNKNLMNRGGVVEKDRQSIQKPLHLMIPISVQEFPSHVVPDNDRGWQWQGAYYQPHSQFMGPTGLGMGSPSIPLVSDSDCHEPLQHCLSLNVPRTPQRVDSPLSSDSGSESSPNIRCQTWTCEQPSMQGYAIPTTVAVSDQQAVDFPCSPESTWGSTSGSPDSHTQWPSDQQSPEHGFNADDLAHQAQSATHYGCPHDLIAYLSNIPRPCDGNILHPATLEEFVREQWSYLDGSVETQAVPHAVTSASPPSPAPQPSTSNTSLQAPESESKVKNSRPKNIKPPSPRPERKPQQSRKTKKSPPLDSSKPKICCIIDQRKESTKAIRRGISLMSEKKFTKENKNGQT